MSPLNRGPLLGPRMPPVGMRPRFGARLPMPGMPLRMPPPPPMGPMFGPMRQRMMPPRPGGPPPLFGPRGRGVPPLMPPMMCPRGMGPRGPPMRPGLRGLLMPQRPPQGLPHMRPRFPMGNGNISAKAINNAKKVSKLEELELKKPWMTDEIRSEIQKKNKLYAKARKNKDAKEWNEFKDLRNKVTRMIRDAKNEYLTKNPEQAHIYEDDSEPYDVRDENYMSSENEEGGYCEVCDREFETAELLDRHTESHKICGVDGCTFSAHPKLVEKHISMQHCTGLYLRMKNLSTPEDIEKWIAERKKKYPTKTNMEQKIAEDTAKRKRGEVIEEKKSFDKSKHARKTPREKNRRVRKRKAHESRAEAEPLSTEYYRGLRPFAGTADLRRTGSEVEKEEEQEMDTEPELVERVVETATDVTVPDFAGNFSDDEEAPMNSLQSGTSASGSSAAEAAKSVPNSVLSLVADYGSESDDDGPEEVPVERARVDPPAKEDLHKMPEVSLAKPTTSTDDEGPEHIPIKRESLDPPIEDDSHDTPETSVAELANESQVNVHNTKSKNARHSRATKPKPVHRERTRPNDKSPRKTPNARYGNKKRLMLLQRLLSRSIQHERNIICQCIKYIADNNFFQ